MDVHMYAGWRVDILHQRYDGYLPMKNIIVT